MKSDKWEGYSHGVIDLASLTGQTVENGLDRVGRHLSDDEPSTWTGTVVFES